MRPESLPIARVEWVDAASHEVGWRGYEEVLEDSDPVVCTSVGFIVLDREDVVVLALSCSPDSDGRVYKVGEVLQIPRECVRDVRPLEERRAKKSG
jgi:hypothetical protein